jgi:hypothetical protein
LREQESCAKLRRIWSRRKIPRPFGRRCCCASQELCKLSLMVVVHPFFPSVFILESLHWEESCTWYIGSLCWRGDRCSGGFWINACLLSLATPWTPSRWCRVEGNPVR